MNGNNEITCDKSLSVFFFVLTFLRFWKILNVAVGGRYESFSVVSSPNPRKFRLGTWIENGERFAIHSSLNMTEWCQIKGDLGVSG